MEYYDLDVVSDNINKQNAHDEAGRKAHRDHLNARGTTQAINAAVQQIYLPRYRDLRRRVERKLLKLDQSLDKLEHFTRRRTYRGQANTYKGFTTLVAEMQVLLQAVEARNQIVPPPPSDDVLIRRYMGSGRHVIVAGSFFSIGKNDFSPGTLVCNATGNPFSTTNPYHLNQRIRALRKQITRGDVIIMNVVEFALAQALPDMLITPATQEFLHRFHEDSFKK